MTLKVNQENMPVICLFGLNFLCNGYVTNGTIHFHKPLKISVFLCNGYVTATLLTASLDKDIAKKNLKGK